MKLTTTIVAIVMAFASTSISMPVEDRFALVNRAETENANLRDDTQPKEDIQDYDLRADWEKRSEAVADVKQDEEEGVKEDVTDYDLRSDWAKSKK